MVRKFTILGERNSGTHFLQYAIMFNFPLEYIRYSKHFFGHEELPNDDDLLTIGIVRDPVEWINSYFRRLHYIPPQNKSNIHNFLFNEFYSIRDIKEDIESKGYEIMEDRHYETGERYKNIFELRQMKNKFLMNLDSKLKHYILVRYEDLRDHFDETLDKLKNQFGLIPYKSEYTKVEKTKGTFVEKYVPKLMLLPDNIQTLIKDHVDKKQEETLGYLKQKKNKKKVIYLEE